MLLVIHCCVLFDETGNTVDEPCIDVNLHRKYRKTSFIFCIIVTADNLI